MEFNYRQTLEMTLEGNDTEKFVEFIALLHQSIQESKSVPGFKIKNKINISVTNETADFVESLVEKLGIKFEEPNPEEQQ